MSADTATYVLVHGGGHGGWCYRSVARILRAAGHDVYTPTLTGLGERSHLLGPGIDLDTHITAVLHYEELRDVILVGHSYGGMVITGAADRAADRVGHIVYLDAANPVGGESLVVHSGPAILAARVSARVVDGVELVLFPGTEPLPNYGVSDPDDIAWMEGRLTPHPWACFEQPLLLENEAALWAIPQTQIVCTVTLPLRDPERMARAAGRVWDIDTGHDLMITEPERVAELLLRVGADLTAAGQLSPASAAGSWRSASCTSGRSDTGGSASPQRWMATCEAATTAPATTAGSRSRSASRPSRSAIASARIRCIAELTLRYSPRIAGARVTSRKAAMDSRSRVTRSS